MRSLWDRLDYRTRDLWGRTTFALVGVYVTFRVIAEVRERRA